jgi:predicted small lipoprotein YifL
MIRILIVATLATNLVACGRAGDLYLTKDYQQQHATKQVPVAPSDSLEPLQSNQRTIYDK